ncbi:hypothetical protein [Myxococcus sp. Y35]|uniref:hypothetical protein n=1 Tax=Pseudomyxococcus flavus TaxID=3115648 RepID=UPI003CF9BC72
MTRLNRGWFVLVAGALFAPGCGDDGGCPDTGPANVTLDASSVFKGTLTLVGTLTLPKGSASGKAVRLAVAGGGTTAKGSVSALAEGTTTGESVTYSITGLIEGTYTVRANVDMNDNGRLGEPGDLDGYSGGTLDAPVLESTAAQKIALGADGASCVNFGLAVLP